jgi:chemotaxis protein histidine kinase CheA
MSTKLMTAAVTPLALTMFSLFSASPARADDFTHIHRLARFVDRQARELDEEVEANFRNTPQYRHLHRDTEEIEELAEHIHQLIDRGASIQHIRRDVQRLDRLVDHVEDLVRELGAFRQIDRTAFFRLSRSAEQLERTIHRLREALED